MRRFHQAVIPDPLLGPIFAAMHVNWSVHIPKLVDFWAGRMLAPPGYSGNPVALAKQRADMAGGAIGALAHRHTATSSTTTPQVTTPDAG